MRTAAGHTQERLAELADLSRNYIGLLETDRREPSLSTLLALGRALNVRLDDLAGSPQRRDEGLHGPHGKPTAAYRKLESIVQTSTEKEVVAFVEILEVCLKLFRSRPSVPGEAKSTKPKAGFG